MCVCEELLRYGQIVAAMESALSESHSSSSCLVLFWTLVDCVTLGSTCGGQRWWRWIMVRPGLQREHLCLCCTAGTGGPTAGGSTRFCLCRALPRGGGGLYSWCPPEDLSLPGSDCSLLKRTDSVVSSQATKENNWHGWKENSGWKLRELPLNCSYQLCSFR